MKSIADMRRAAGLTQAAAASALGVAQASLATWETGETRPKVDKIMPLAALYGVEPGAILTAITDAKEEAADV